MIEMTGASLSTARRKLLRQALRLVLKKESASALVLAVGLNLAFMGLAAAAGVARPPVNLDFLLAAFLLHKGPWGRAAAVALVIVGAAYEIYRYVAGVYLFDLGRLLDVFGYVQAWPLAEVARYTAGLLLAAGVLFGLGRLASRFRFRNAALLGVGLMLAAFDGASSQGRFSVAPTAQPGPRLAYTSFGAAVELVSAHLNGGGRPGPVLKGVRSYDAALAARGESDVLVIAAESLGVFADPAEQAAFQAEIASALGVADARFGVETSKGVTLDGELRVLCSTGLGAPDHSITHARERCLPRLFAQAGYSVAAAHAYDGAFYKRTERYPRLGFQRTRFLDPERDRRCEGAFPGACDEDVLRDLLSVKPGPEGRFLYQLTLETHLPQPECGGLEDPIASYRCKHLAYFARLGQAIATLDRPTRVVIVGDHPPPFPSAEDRKRFKPEAVTVLTFDAG
ncbi:MAG TPA: sulfatase-like hydrolase/transferase [Caulobacteraceae bacterium]|nr:sulfatase-like hydrolase/transferase [Caulobacteraceae bacterium]